MESVLLCAGSSVCFPTETTVDEAHILAYSVHQAAFFQIEIMTIPYTTSADAC